MDFSTAALTLVGGDLGVGGLDGALGDPGGKFNGFFGPEKWTQHWPENWPEVPFEKVTCLSFQFWTFQTAFQAAFTTVVPFRSMG